jgi:pimeloyl-ACP methyl ester carboxylesterase
MSRDAAVRYGEVTLHGQRMAYREAGEGPVIVLIHGIVSSSETWEPVIGRLGRQFTVVAPDMLGHGRSSKPRGDYSLGAYASSVRDLLAALGHDRVTLVGHSLGGGVVMQFAYQFPERVERMALVSSGGLGRDVSLLLRSAGLPGAELVLPLLASEPLRDAAGWMARSLGRVGLRPGNDLAGVAEGFGSLGDFGARRAFVQTVRGIIDLGGQRVDATEKLYLAGEIPMLLVWGEGDRIIPVAHGRAAAALMPGSRLEVFERAGHFPHRDDPARFTDALSEFVEDTFAADLDPEDLRRRLLSHTAEVPTPD